MNQIYRIKKQKLCRLSALILTLIFLLSSISISVVAVEKNSFDDSNVMTDTLLLVDTSTGETLYSKNSNTTRSMASTVKIMTYIVAAESINDIANEMIEITSQPIEDIADAEASTSGFENHIGESYSALDILYGMMLPSGCEAAQILAYHIGGTPKNFAEMMNQKAVELGCENTYFAEAHGLSDENHTTAEDMVKIAKYALTLPYFKEIVSSEYYTAANYSYPFINTNYLIDAQNGGKYYYPYATGIKTGYTSTAGKCLVSTAKKGDTEYMCIALGGAYSSTDGYINHAMTDTVDLYKWAFYNYTDNIEVEIENSYASVKIGENLQINATITENTTTETPEIKWSSSDESIATVDENGIVSAKSLGQAMITAKSQTGNFDTVAVSCGFYNGIDVTSRYGDYSTGSKEPVNWKAVKNYGFDFSVIRAGWGSEDYPNQNDAEFVNNVKGAYENNIPFYLSFIAYAQSKEEAEAEADYFLREMTDYFPEECSDGLISVVYNMTYSPYKTNDKTLNTEIALAFASKLKAKGYNTVIFANKAIYSNLDTAKLIQNSVGTYYSYYPYSVDFSNAITTPEGIIPQMWQFRSDGYVPEASEALNTKQSLIYMISSFADEITAPKLNVQLSGNNDVNLNWISEDIPADSYKIYEITDNNKTLIAQVDGDIINYTVHCHNTGKHSFVLEKIMLDTLTKEQITLTSEIINITTYHHLDINRDGRNNINDATYIQKVLANMTIANEDFDTYGDANNDGVVNVADVTYIQKILTSLIEYNCEVK